MINLDGCINHAVSMFANNIELGENIRCKEETIYVKGYRNIKKVSKKVGDSNQCGKLVFILIGIS